MGKAIDTHSKVYQVVLLLQFSAFTGIQNAQMIKAKSTETIGDGK